MATTTHGSLAEAATAHLTRGGSVVPVWRGGATELHSQASQLCEWALAGGHIVNFVENPEWPKSSGAEHDVFFDAGTSRVLKRTRKGSFGSIKTSIGIRKTASPYFYLCRLLFSNDIFDLDLRFEGVINGEWIALLISQPWTYPKDIKNPYPTDDEVQEFMAALDFEPIQGSPHEWFRESDGYHVCDGRPDNFIKSQSGVVPIDLIVSKRV